MFFFLLPFFSGFFFLASSLGEMSLTAATDGAEPEGAGPEGLGGVGFELHSTVVALDGMGTSSTTERTDAKY